MKNLMKNFLAPYFDKTLVIGFSGGPDSLALFKAAAEAGQKIVLAHLDHGWRPESGAEALRLQAFAQERGVPFYLKTCVKGDFEGNLEQAGRLKRLAFFREVADAVGAAGVLLGHHADDLGENVLKKLFEGASFYNLASMKKEGAWEGLPILRPFLSIGKREILDYVKDEPFIEDPSNITDEFLRGRIRSEILPILNEKFRKNIRPALCQLAEQSLELEGFIEEISSLCPVVEDDSGYRVDLSGIHQSPFLLKGVIRHFLRQRALSASREDLSALAEAIRLKRGSFTKVIKERRVLADRGTLHLAYCTSK